MKILILSDTHGHLDDRIIYYTKKVEEIWHAGDIGSLYKFEQLQQFMEKLSQYFQIILYVPGNHEWYRQKNYKGKL